jgi:phosphate uptake regulator
MFTLQKETLMAKTKEDILKDKEFLATESLKVANEALGYLQDALPECSARDLVAIFNSAVKTHRDIVSDIVSLTEQDSKSEQELAKEYDSKVDQLLNKLKGKE